MRMMAEATTKEDMQRGAEAIRAYKLLLDVSTD
jgi:hypothetical protein